MNKILFGITVFMLAYHASASDKMLPEFNGVSIQKVIKVWGYPIFSSDYIDLPGPREVFTYRHGYSNGIWACITSFTYEGSRGILFARQIGTQCPKNFLSRSAQ